MEGVSQELDAPMLLVIGDPLAAQEAVAIEEESYKIIYETCQKHPVLNNPHLCFAIQVCTSRGTTHALVVM